MASKDQHIVKKKYLKKISFSNTFDIWHYFWTALKTFKYRHVQKIAEVGTIVGRRTEIINASRVKIGAYCLIQDHVYMRAGMEGSIVIKDYCAINSFAKLFGHGGIEIGEHSQLGPGTLITTTSHIYKESLKAEFKKVSIGRFVWVGAQVIILPGVNIGDRSVIGAGSIVIKSIPANSVAVGNPARIVKNI